jgi:hypothetical protein
MLKRILQNLVVILLVLLLQTGMALAEKSVPKTGDPAWDTLSQVKKDWMLKLYDIVVVDRPELKPIADESLEWRLKEMEYDTKKFQYMSDKHPDMIVRDKGLYAFANLDWFPQKFENFRRVHQQLEQKRKTQRKVQEVHGRTGPSAKNPDFGCSQSDPQKSVSPSLRSLLFSIPL